MHVIAGKAVGFKLALSDEFRDDQRRTVENARVLAETLTRAGLRLVSGGTDNHLMLVDVTSLGVTGKEAEHLLDEIGITVNKNQHPVRPRTAEHVVRDPGRALRPSPPWASAPAEMRDDRPHHRRGDRKRDEPAGQARLADEVAAMVARFPVPGPRRGLDEVHPRRRPAIVPALVGRVRIAATLLALVLTPAVRRFARRSTLVDRPDARRVNVRPDPTRRWAGRRSRLPVGRRSWWSSSPTGTCPGRRVPRRRRAAGSSAPCSSAALSRRRSASSMTSSDLRARWQLARPAGRRAGRGRPRGHRRLHRQPVRPRVRSGSTAPCAIGFTVVWIVGHDQQHQLHRRPRWPVVGDRPDRCGDARADQPDDASAVRPAVHRGPLLRARRSRCSGSCAGTSTRRRSSSGRAA